MTRFGGSGLMSIALSVTVLTSGAVCTVLGDEVDDVLTIESTVEAEVVKVPTATSVDTPGSAEDPFPAEVAVPVEPAEVEAPEPEGAVAAMALPDPDAAVGVSAVPSDVGDLVSSPGQSATELQAARQEIERLKGIVVQILEANRRERLTMHYNMGCVYRAGKQYRKAEQEFMEALRLNPDDPDIHYNLAILYDDDLKNLKKARQHYERFIDLAPDDKDVARVQEWLTSLQ